MIHVDRRSHEKAHTKIKHNFFQAHFGLALIPPSLLFVCQPCIVTVTDIFSGIRYLEYCTQTISARDTTSSPGLV